MTHLHTSTVSSHRGLTRTEVLWLLVVAALAMLVILGTTKLEREHDKKDQAVGVMEHLEGRMLLQARRSKLPEGEFRLPPGEWVGEEILTMIPGDWLPPDPWGGEYRLLVTVDGTVQLSCTGIASPPSITISK